MRRQIRWIAGIGWLPTTISASTVPALISSAARVGDRFLRVTSSSPNPAAASNSLPLTAVPEPGSPIATTLPARSAIERIGLSARTDDVQRLGEQAGDRPQPRHRALVGKGAGAGIGHCRQIGLGKARFELAAVDQPQIVDRASRRLRHRHQPGHAAAAGRAAGRALDRARYGAGDDAADLEKAAAGRRRADAEKPALGFRRCGGKQGGKKQTGAGEAAPAIS